MTDKILDAIRSRRAVIAREVSRLLEEDRRLAATESAYEGTPHPPIRQGYKRRVTDALLKQVADVYRENNEAGAFPTLAVAREFNVSRSTSARWVGLARSAGKLPRTKQGESRS